MNDRVRLDIRDGLATVALTRPDKHNGIDFEMIDAVLAAQLSVRESKWGLVPDIGGAALLSELVGIDVAKELCFTSRVLSGADAHALGLVTEVAPDPFERAKQLALEIMTRSPDAVASA